MVTSPTNYGDFINKQPAKIDYEDGADELCHGGPLKSYAISIGKWEMPSVSGTAFVTHHSEIVSRREEWRLTRYVLRKTDQKDIKRLQVTGDLTTICIYMSLWPSGFHWSYIVVFDGKIIVKNGISAARPHQQRWEFQQQTR